MENRVSQRKKSIIPVLGLTIILTLQPITNAQDKGQFENPPDTQELSVPMTPPAQALALMELPPGFRSTLFAAEPDVHQPISITTDARGRVWVAECYTYSDRSENYNTQLNDRIVIFEDTDNDGVFDKKKIFWDQFKKLTSLEVGHGGVWVTSAPNLLFIPDADQDDVPDGEPIVLLNGFEGDVIRHNIVNGLRWGPDGWLYGRHGIQATSFVGKPDATDSQRIAMNCSIWRYHPYHHKFEIVAQGGTNPWGFDFDEHGEMFMINTVIGHLFHVVPNARYRRMYGAHFNPHLYQVIEQTADHFHWDVREKHTAVTSKDGMSDGTDLAGGGHAHTGLMIYQGANWPKEFHNRLFTANFHGRRINSDSIIRQGNSYVAHHGPDYFKSRDPWFRGVEMVYGPDGGVYLLDWSDIGECHENDGIHRTSGRIFKLTYGQPEQDFRADLSNLKLNDLIKLLSHKNDWYSRKARRLLQQQAMELRQLESRRSEPQENNVNIGKYSLDIYSKELRLAYFAATDVKSKLRILWAIYSCDQDIEPFLLSRLDDNNEHIRAWSVRLLADGINEPSEDVATKFIELAKSDSSGLVRLYVAGSLPRFAPSSAIRIASELATHAQDANDRVQPNLIWYGLEPHVTSHVDESIKLAIETKIPQLRKNITRRLVSEIENNPTAARTIVTNLAEANKQVGTDLLVGMVEALNGWNRATPPENWSSASEKLAQFNDDKINRLVQSLNLVFGDGRATDELVRIVNDSGQDIATRRQAIATLAKSSSAPNLFDLFSSHITNKALTTEITKALVRCTQPGVAKIILRRYAHMDPAGKVAAVNTLVSRSAWASQLLKAIADNRVPKSAITAAHARQIGNFEDEELSNALKSVWGTLRRSSDERVAEINRIRAEVSSIKQREIDLVNGRALFEKGCASCHTLFGSGGKIGPDLTGSDRKNLNYLLENIIDPSASVAQSYQNSIIALDDGRLMTGVIVEENARTIMLQTKDELHSIDVTTIDSRRKTTNSLMPDGLLDNLSDEEITNLFGFLAN